MQQRTSELLTMLRDTNLSRDYERFVTIEKIVAKAMPIAMLKKYAEPGAVELTLDLHLTRLIESLNLKWNLQTHQIKTIVEDLIDKYQYESLEDFILIFKRARQGEFGELYRLDSAVIFGWMERYLEEKYEAFERIQQRGTIPIESVSFPEVSPEVVQEVKEFAEGLKKTMKKEIPITDQEIWEEGQERAKLKSVSGGYVSTISKKAHELHIQWIKENHFSDGKRRPEFVEESIWIKTKT